MQIGINWRNQTVECERCCENKYDARKKYRIKKQKYNTCWGQHHAE